MILDTSAIIAVIVREPGCEHLTAKLNASVDRSVGSPTLLEAAIVLNSKLGAESREILQDFLSDLEVSVVPFGDPHWRVAFEAHRRFGKGRHQAALNFGDCLTYAIAKVAGKPLLCVGNDFSRTDIHLA